MRGTEVINPILDLLRTNKEIVPISTLNNALHNLMSYSEPLGGNIHLLNRGVISDIYDYINFTLNRINGSCYKAKIIRGVPE